MDTPIDAELLELSEKIISYYRYRGMNKEAYNIYKIVTKDKKISPKLANEYIIFAFYNDIKDVDDQLVICLNEYTGNESTNIFNNLKFYAKTLTHVQDIDFSEKEDGYTSSSCCILPYNDGYIMNVRFVNYTIVNNNIYVYSTPEKYPITFNKKLVLTKDFEITDSIKSLDNIEDVRIFNHNGKIVFSGSYCGHRDNIWGVSQAMGDYMSEESPGGSDGNVMMGFTLMDTIQNSSCEKNWCYTYYKDELYFVYNWYPMLTLGKVNVNNVKKVSTIVGEKDCYMLDFVHRFTMPKFFERARGSSCGFEYDSEIWFTIHLVSYEVPRYYYHVIVVFDKDYNLSRYTAPFRFEGKEIEYNLSILVEQERIIMSYSTWDCTSHVRVYDKKYIDSLLNYKPS